MTSLLTKVYFVKQLLQFPKRTNNIRTSSLQIEQIQLILKQRKMDAIKTARSDPVVLKLDTPVFNSIFSKNLNDLAAVFKNHGYEIRIAGGAVRDLLLGKKPSDIDFATTATPTQMKEMFETEDIRMVNMNGEKHGTITPRINNDENFEVTTLRIDVVTDGRHAEVQYTNDWLLDANRRDLTINSMFLDFDGRVYDYFYGWDDLQKRRVAFVGDAATRIQEDYLRILRYFRFYGRITDDASNHEPETIKAITENISGLQKVSGERIWNELKKILHGNFASELVVTLLECKAAKYIGLPESHNIDSFINTFKISKQYEIPLQPISLLCGLLATPTEALALHQRLKLTAYERDLATFLLQNASAFKDKNDIGTYQLMCILNKNPKIFKTQIEELLKFLDKRELWEKFSSWEMTRLPVNSPMLELNGLPRGNIHGIVLKEMTKIWVNNEFSMDADELIKHLPTILENCPTVEMDKPNKKQKTKRNH